MHSAYRFQLAWLGGDELTEDVTITIEGDRIASIEVGVSSGATPVAGVAIPGLVTAHSHAFHRALRGRTHEAGGDFWAWREPMYRLAGDLDPDSYHSLARSLFTEMLAAGYTTVGEFHYVHHQVDGTPYEDPNAMGHALLAAASDAGIRITLLDTLYLASDVDGTPPLPGQIRFSDRHPDTWAERVSQIQTGPASRVGVAAHSVRAVPPEGLAKVGALADELECPAHVHVSEQIAENEASEAQFGSSPVQHLAQHGLLGESVTLVHATHVSEADRSLIAASGASVCFCPTTEADLGDGIGPAKEFADLDVAISLGSDSNAVVDPFLEMRQLEHHDRLRHMRRGLHSPGSLLGYASLNGARSLGWDAGQLEAGRLADIVVVKHSDSDSRRHLGGLAMATTAADVHKVMVGGRMVVT